MKFSRQHPQGVSPSMAQQGGVSRVALVTLTARSRSKPFMIEFWFNFLDSNPCTFISPVPFYTVFYPVFSKNTPTKDREFCCPPRKSSFPLSSSFYNIPLLLFTVFIFCAVEEAVFSKLTGLPYLRKYICTVIKQYSK